MSLIDEALKRARQEAARQDEAARELRYKQVPVIPGLRQPARRSWLLPAVVAACVVAGIGIGLGLSRVRGGGEDQRAAVPPPASALAAAPAPVRVAQAPVALPEETEPPALVEKPEKSEKPVPAPAVPVQESAPAPARQEAPAIAEMRQREIALNPAPRPQSAPPETRESEPAAPAPPATAPAAAAPAVSAPGAAELVAPAAAAEAGQVRTYQQELPLAGGGTLRLNGIAFSEQPVALFGGKVVALGENVAGYKVVAIEARRVRLEGQGGVVVVEMP